MIDNWRAPLLYDGGMYPVPTSLSPSRVEAFTSCPMAFRFASIERLPESPSPHMTKGSLVHRVLELLFAHPAAARTIETARLCFHQAVDEYSIDPEFTLLHLDDDQQQAFVDDSWTLVEAYFRMEDPTAVREIGLEIRLEAQVGSLALRGIIDRLELDADGGLGRHRLQDRPGSRAEVRAGAPGRRSLLLVPVRRGARSPSIGDPVDVPAHRRDHHRAALGAVGEVHHHAHDRGVESGRAGMHHRQLPAPPGPAVPVVLVPAVVSGIRRRPRSGRRRSTSATRRARRVKAVDSFDHWGDRQLERLRGNAVADTVFKTASTSESSVGSGIVIGIGRAIIDPSVVRQSLTMSALIGAESLIVNQGIKRVFRRTRPTEIGRPAVPVSDDR